jgi:hypothetical protein
MLPFNNVSSVLARILGVNSWMNGFGEAIPPQREFFYVGGEYQNLYVSHIKLRKSFIDLAGNTASSRIPYILLRCTTKRGVKWTPGCSISTGQTIS